MRFTAYAEGEVAFLVNVQDKLHQLDWMLAHLRAHYPFVRVEVVGDGDEGKAADIARRYRAGYATGPSLFPLPFGGRIVVRTLSALVAGPERWGIKVDVDTGFYRRLAALPDEPCVAGSVQHVGDDADGLGSIQGGCVIFERRAAVAMLASNLLLDPRLADSPEQTWARSPALRQARVSVGRTSEDWCVGWAAAELKIPLVDHPEIRCRWGRFEPNFGDRYAITHPHKECRL